MIARSGPSRARAPVARLGVFRVEPEHPGVPVWNQAWELIREEWAFLPDERDEPDPGLDQAELLARLPVGPERPATRPGGPHADQGKKIRRLTEVRTASRLSFCVRLSDVSSWSRTSTYLVSNPRATLRATM